MSECIGTELALAHATASCWSMPILSYCTGLGLEWRLFDSRVDKMEGMMLLDRRTEMMNL